MRRDLKAAPPGDAQVPLNGNGALARHAFELVGMRWNWLIVAEVLGGARRFNQLEQDLEIPCAVLMHRLSVLIAQGVLERRRYGSRRDRYEYWPTDKGHDLYPALLALASWGEHHASALAPPAVTLDPGGNGQGIGRSDPPHQLPSRNGGTRTEASGGVFPYGITPTTGLDGNGSAARRALELAGLPWNLLIVAEVLGGIRRFEQLQQDGKIPRKTLARRLSMLVAHGVLERRQYDESRRDRHEYWPTDKGRGLYPALDALVRWGDRYMPAEQRAAPNN
jgi:DNA-binding HxlR family transcriptional regulator